MDKNELYKNTSYKSWCIIEVETLRVEEAELRSALVNLTQEHGRTDAVALFNARIALLDISVKIYHAERLRQIEVNLEERNPAK